MKHFCIRCGATLSANQYICPICHSNVYLDMLDDKLVEASSGLLSAINVELNTQWVKYRCGKDGSAGHGFAAEDYNSLSDMLQGFSVETTGRCNAKDGPDRIVNGVQVQTKYYCTAQKTINSAFADNGTGKYRYTIKDNLSKLQRLEVPSDQYEECIPLMEEKIRNGQVEGVSDPKAAKDILIKGSCSYPQAKAMTISGTIDSLILDIKTGTVIALSSLGVSFCVKLGLAVMSCRNMDDLKCSIQLCFLESIKSGLTTMSTSILSMQIIRTQFGRNFVALVHNAGKGAVESIYGTSFGKQLTHDIASKMWDKTLTGASAKGVVTKLVRLNAVTGIATIAVMSLPDTFRCFVSKSISKPQFVKNLIVNGSSVVGATIGGILGMRFGKPGAFVGALVGGATGSILTKTIADKISKDDSLYMQELIKIALVELSNEYLIQREDEFNRVVENIKIDGVIDTNLLRAMYQAGAENNNDVVRVQIAKLALEYNFGVVARNRNLRGKTFKILGNEQLILESINEIDCNIDK